MSKRKGIGSLRRNVGGEVWANEWMFIGVTLLVRLALGNYWQMEKKWQMENRILSPV